VGTNRSSDRVPASQNELERLGLVTVTGAAGLIGSTLRDAWRGRFPHLRLVDRGDLGEEGEGEELRVLDLAAFGAAKEAVRGADAVVHLAAIPEEDRFDRLLEANVTATYNVFEAARQAGVRRVVFASTNHVTGFYARTERIGPDHPVRPDSLYGVTKVFGEALGRLYADKWGLEVVCLRIGAFGDRPASAEVLPMWLSPGDAVRLCTRALVAPDVRFLVVYGVSRVPDSWWDNPGAAAIGYVPLDDVDPELRRRLAVEADLEAGVQGGRFASRGYWIEP
jgi:uronate dehydrogenase